MIQTSLIVHAVGNASYANKHLNLFMILILFKEKNWPALKEAPGLTGEKCAMSVMIPECRNLISLMQQRVHCGSTSDNVISLRRGGALKRGKEANERWSYGSGGNIIIHPAPRGPYHLRTYRGN